MSAEDPFSSVDFFFNTQFARFWKAHRLRLPLPGPKMSSFVRFFHQIIHHLFTVNSQAFGFATWWMHYCWRSFSWVLLFNHKLHKWMTPLYNLVIYSVIAFIHLKVCLPLNLSLLSPLLRPPFWARGPSLWSAAGKGNLKGSRINKNESKPNKAATRLQWTCWFRGGVGPQRALCERASAPYSCGVLTQPHSNTHCIHRHGSIMQKQLDESILYKSLKITNVSISRSLTQPG